MPTNCVEKHQLAGLDERARGFNRVVEIERVGTVCQAILRYEQSRVAAEGHASETEAVRGLIGLLHAQGYRQLRSQLSFRGTTYYGNREPWIEYPDPVEPATIGNLFAKIFSCFRRRETTS